MGGTLRSQGHGAVSRPFPICFLAVTFIFRSHRPYNGRVTLDEAMAALEAAGTAQARKIYRRHGLAEPLLGVSYADLGKLKKQVRRDQQLAQGLWDTRVHDAQVLATMVAGPAAFDRGLAGQWAGTRSITPWPMPSRRMSLSAPRGPRDWPMNGLPPPANCCGAPVGPPWVAAPRSAMRPYPMPGSNTCCQPSSATSTNRRTGVKEAMNSALIAIGSRNPALRGPAIAAAGRIGKVAVGHGETSCKTPDAIGYIEKTHARRALTAR